MKKGKAGFLVCLFRFVVSTLTIRLSSSVITYLIFNAALPKPGATSWPNCNLANKTERIIEGKIRITE